jgi:hypothetical protein
MMLELNAWWLLGALGAMLAVIFVLWLYNRRERRRKFILRLARSLTKFEGVEEFLGDLIDTLDCYAAGDYSGLVEHGASALRALGDDKLRAEKAFKFVRGLCRIYRHEPTKVETLLEDLGVRSTAKPLGT